jgi:prepilin-type N-terminal cleavage/methylation domain-containing protein
VTNRRATSRGFTLVEILVASTLGAIVMAALLSCFVFLARNFTRLANNQALEQQARVALARLQADLNQAKAIKAGTTPTETSVTLVLPAGDVTYTFDAANERLRRQATFGTAPDITLLNSALCRCTDFRFRYYTGSLGAPVDQLNPASNVPYSIKRIQAGFSLETPSAQSPETRVAYDVVSAHFQIRQKQAPDGS